MGDHPSVHRREVGDPVHGRDSASPAGGRPDDRRVISDPAIGCGTRSAMSYIAVLCLGLLASQVAAGNAGKELPVRFVGAFTNFRETGEHVYGYQLELWRRSD